MNIGPCVRRQVRATIITPGGQWRFVGTNYCNNAQQVCPRRDMPTGMGYELCRDICQQPAHAEVNAVARFREMFPGGFHVNCFTTDAEGKPVDKVMCYIEGHTYSCKACFDALRGVGVAEIHFGAPPGWTAGVNAHIIGDPV